MNFKEKVRSSISNFIDIDLPDYPNRENKLNLYCDFIELMAVFSKRMDGISFGDIQIRFFGTKEYNSDQQKHRDEEWIENLLYVIDERSKLFNENYPFDFKNSTCLNLKEDLSWKNKMYLGMLISSKLNIFNNFKTELSSEFEMISYHVLKNFLPPNTIIRAFGKNSYYSGNTKSKIRSLANELRLKTKEEALMGISDRSTQDRGLDIIGWIPFEDKCINQLIFLVQCTCAKNIGSKSFDTQIFKRYLEFYNSPQHFLFIPYSLIDTSRNKFYQEDFINDECLLFERKRILDIFNQKEAFLELKILKVVDAFLTQGTGIEEF